MNLMVVLDRFDGAYVFSDEDLSWYSLSHGKYSLVAFHIIHSSMSLAFV